MGVLRPRVKSGLDDITEQRVGVADSSRRLARIHDSQREMDGAVVCALGVGRPSTG